jgi:hypothetical protein
LAPCAKRIVLYELRARSWRRFIWLTWPLSQRPLIYQAYERHMNTSSLVQKVWNFCHTLRDDGVGYGDYLEQLTYLLFLKLAHEYAQEPYNRDTHIPQGYDWASLRKVGEPLEAHYLATLHKLGQEPGMLGAIFFKAQNKIQDPAKLSRLVQMIDAESWISLDADTKGDLYEGLLQKNAEDTKSGAGQYFTPRALIEAMVACVRPEPMKTIADPACGTGGFFLGAYNWLTGRPGAKLDTPEGVPARQDLPRQRDRAQHAPHVPDEPVSAQHRRAGRRAFGGARRMP